MTKITCQEIDSILLPWAKEQVLYVMTEYKDEEVRSITVVNDFGDEFQIYLAPDTDNEETKVIVGADLLQLGGKKHSYHRERKKFHFREAVSLADLEAVLNRALQLTGEWTLEIH
jgi:hypothetical protein